jgi:hypothetical protein
LARVNLEVSGKQIEVKGAVADRLPMGALLRTDVPQRSLLMNQVTEDAVVDTMVVARQGAKRQKREAAEKCRIQRGCGVVPHPLLPMDMGEMNEAEG